MVASGASSRAVRGDPVAVQHSAASLSGVALWGATDIGRERVENEDAIYPDFDGSARYVSLTSAEIARKGQLLLVADGVGGDTVGSTASQWAIRLTAERYYALPGADFTVDLRDAFEYGNEALYRYLQSTGRSRRVGADGMDPTFGVKQAGSTLAAAVIHNGVLYSANVGNSRVYLLRDGALYQQSRDHTVAQRKVDRGEITQAEAMLDPDASVLTRALGAVASVVVDVFRPLPLADGDAVVVCSDGLYEMVSDDEITRIVRNHPPRRAVESLIEAANAQGGYDNVSVIVAQIGGAVAQASRAPGFVAVMKEDLAGLDVAHQRLLWILFAVAALVLFAAMFALGWSLYSPRASSATMEASALLVLQDIARRGGYG